MKESDNKSWEVTDKELIKNLKKQILHSFAYYS